MRRLATATEWIVTIGFLGLYSKNLNTDAQALFLILILTTGTRYRLYGVIGSTMGASCAIGIFVMTQYSVFKILDVHEALKILLFWELLFGLDALIIGGLVKAGDECFAWEKARRLDEDIRIANQDAELQRLQMRQIFSNRELTLLPFLAQEDLTYRDIGARLHISSETVKVHVRRIGGKLGVSGRRAIVKAIKGQDLLSGSATGNCGGGEVEG